MPISVWIVSAVALFAVLALWRWARTWWTFRGKRAITCPENHRPAGVTLDASRAARTALSGAPALRLSQCSRWPERASCGQECLSQIQAAPHDCLVRTILLNWYAGKSCVRCGQPIGEIPLGGSHPALLVAGNKTLEWETIPAEELQDTLKTAQPVCFACHMANTLVQDHPQVAIDRGRGVGPIRKS